MKKIGFAIIGCGVIAKIHASCIQCLAHGELIGVYDANPLKAQAFSREYACISYQSLQELLDDGRVTAVAIVTPSGLHGQLGIQAANNGKHIIVEKPIEITLVKGNDLVKAARKANVKLCCISQHRFDNSIVQLKSIIQSGDMGKLNFGSCQTKWYREQSYYDSASWRGSWSMDGGGALMNQSIHYVDLLRYIMGEVDEVSAYCATRAHTNIEVEDIGVAAVHFENGAIGLIEGNTAAWPGYYARLDIYGTDGSVIIQDDEVINWNMKSAAEYIPEDNSEKTTGASSAEISYDSHFLQYEDICEAILLNREPLVNGEDALETLKIILAIYQSAQTGRPVSPKSVADMPVELRQKAIM